MTLRPVSGPQFCPAGSVSVRAVVRDLNLGSIPISPSSGAEVTNFTREAQQESEGTGNDDFANAGKPLQISSNGHRVITGINTNNSTGNCTGKRHYRASVTHYGPCGQPDGRACGFLPVNGFTAAASAQLYASPGKGQIGHACGSCWLVHGKTDSSGRPSNTNDIVVQINNECPFDSPLCNATSLVEPKEFNAVEAPVNIDLCDSSGAPAAFWSDEKPGMAIGWITEVPCNGCWQGHNLTGNPDKSWGR